MARKVQIVLEDDIDGGPADETVAFALDGAGYEIDLSAANAAALRDALAPYVGAARKAGRSAAGRPARRSSRTTAVVSDAQHDPAAVRAWAREQGIEVSERGRISADVRARYEAATH